MPEVEPERCPTCFKSLSYRDNDDPLMNYVARCENEGCSDPFVELYYEEPADAAEFRKTELWYECWIDSYVMEESDIDTEPCNNTKRADALYMKRIEELSAVRVGERS